jgi:hypothetical protein
MNMNVIQPMNNPPWGDLFQQLSEHAFVLETVQNLQPNIFVGRMMDFFYQLPQFRNRELSNQLFTNLNSALSTFLLNMYSYYFDGMYDEEQIINTTNSLINAIIEINN